VAEAFLFGRSGVAEQPPKGWLGHPLTKKKKKKKKRKRKEKQKQKQKKSFLKTP